MKVGIVSDIHGNARALSKALSLLESADLLLCLGDSINQYRFSNEVVGLLRDRDVITIWGNHEEAFFDPLNLDARSASGIDPALLQWLSARPRQLEFELGAKRIIMNHATPWPGRYDYVPPGHRDFAAFAAVDADIILYGHTHQPVVCEIDGKLIINPGSVGHGRIVDKAIVFSFAFVDTVRHEAELVDFTLEQETADMTTGQGVGRGVA